MSAGKKRAPRIPPGAPGHPREGNGSSRGPQAPRERRPRRLEEAVPAREARETQRPGPGRASARLVYEDETILAYDKDAGLAVISPEGSRTRCLLDIATEQVRRHNPKGRAAVVHRIDRDTSGLVVFAASAGAKKLLMGAWDELVSERLYLAVVEGRMPAPSGILDSWIKENQGGEVFQTTAGERGAKRAVTRWKVRKEGAGASLVELSLETGRKHQIRVQLAASGHPVLGDRKYGRALAGRGDRGRDGAGEGPGRLCLHASAIELSLPGRERVRLECPVPPEFAAAVASSRPHPVAERPRAGPGRRSANAPRGASSSSRPGARSGDPRGRGAPHGR